MWKIEDQLLHTQEQSIRKIQVAAKEAFENNMHHHDTMKTIAKAYLVFCTRDSLPYLPRTETKENLSSCLFF